jgi:hypothetical protein
MTLRRNEDWPTLLHEYIQNAIAQTFSWGEHDCCLLIADEVLAMTGVDLAEPYRGKYTDAASAVALINATCGGKTAVDLWQFVALQNDIKQLPSPLFAQRGDVVSLEDNTLGFVHLDGKHIVCYGQDDKLHIVELATGLVAWRVG